MKAISRIGDTKTLNAAVKNAESLGATTERTPDRVEVKFGADTLLASVRVGKSRWITRYNVEYYGDN